MKKVFLILLLILIAIGGVVLFRYIKKPALILKNQQTAPTTGTTEVQEPNEFIHDKDKDGILDTKEQELGLSDYEFDTDKDGLSDFSEINTWKTDPTKKDTDGDGFNDGKEVLSGYNPLGPGKLTK